MLSHGARAWAPIQKGTSGNPGGRPRRLRQLELAIEEGHAGPKVLVVVDKLYDLALGGTCPSRALLDRVMGPLRPHTDFLPAPVAVIQTSQDIQDSVRGLVSNQVAALQAKARSEGAGSG